MTEAPQRHMVVQFQDDIVPPEAAATEASPQISRSFEVRTFEPEELSNRHLWFLELEASICSAGLEEVGKQVRTPNGVAESCHGHHSAIGLSQPQLQLAGAAPSDVLLSCVVPMLNMLLNLRDGKAVAGVSRTMCNAAREEAVSLSTHSYSGACIDYVETRDTPKSSWAGRWSHQSSRSLSHNHSTSIQRQEEPAPHEMRKDASRLVPDWHVDGCVVHDLSNILRPNLGEGTHYTYTEDRTQTPYERFHDASDPVHNLAAITRITQEDLTVAQSVGAGGDLLQWSTDKWPVAPAPELSCCGRHRGGLSHHSPRQGFNIYQRPATPRRRQRSSSGNRRARARVASSISKQNCITSWQTRDNYDRERKLRECEDFHIGGLSQKWPTRPRSNSRNHEPLPKANADSYYGDIFGDGSRVHSIADILRPGITQGRNIMPRRTETSPVQPCFQSLQTTPRGDSFAGDIFGDGHRIHSVAEILRPDITQGRNIMPRRTETSPVQPCFAGKNSVAPNSVPPQGDSYYADIFGDGSRVHNLSEILRPDITQGRNYMPTRTETSLVQPCFFGKDYVPPQGDTFAASFFGDGQRVHSISEVLRPGHQKGSHYTNQHEHNDRGLTGRGVSFDQHSQRRLF